MTHNLSSEFLMQEPETKRNMIKTFGRSTNPDDPNYSPMKHSSRFVAQGCGCLLAFALIVGGIGYGCAKGISALEYYYNYSQSSKLADKVFGNNDGELDDSEKSKWYNSMGISSKEPTVRQLRVFNGFAEAYESRRNK
ncbi:Uncharacterised protein [uncultured archaeon]|nr:Uncharacterised protein [uncultured archaeon]